MLGIATTNSESNEDGLAEMEGIEFQGEPEPPENDAPPVEEQNEKDEENSSDGKEGGSEKEESSSSDGKGASGGSGGGYQADDDCSSSESSEGKNGDGSSGDASNRKDQSSKSETQPILGKTTSTSAIPDHGKSEGPIDRSSTLENDQNSSETPNSGEKQDGYSRLHHNHQSQRALADMKYIQASLPQWNGVRIQHPMDPRIDLSTVGYYCASNLQGCNDDSAPRPPASMKHPPSPGSATANAASAMHLASHNAASSTNNADMSSQAALMFPTFEQYMKLMEVTTSTETQPYKIPFLFCHSRASIAIVYQIIVGPSVLPCSWLFQ